MTLSRTGLIDQILSVMNMMKYNYKLILANKAPLGKNKDRDPCMEEREYRSVVGMMMYLAGSTRSNIAYVAHQ